MLFDKAFCDDIPLLSGKQAQNNLINKQSVVEIKYSMISQLRDLVA
jgi:hypothetical protein